jgi:signal transduction histidine kinase
VERQRTPKPYGRSYTRKWLKTLAHAGDLLAMSLDYETTLASVARLVVPSIADLCLVDVFDGSGTLQRVAVAHANPERAPLLEQLRVYAPDLSAEQTLAEVIRTRRPLLLTEPPVEETATEGGDPAYHAIVRALGIRSQIIVPLIAHEQTLGAITLATADTQRRFRPSDLLLAMDMAHRCALAVDNARLYRQAQETLRTRDELFDLIAHDLKNPLTVIAGNVQLLQRRLAQPEVQLDPAMAARRLEQVAAAAIQMRTMINDLLDLARLRDNQPLELALEPTDLVALARRAVSEYQQTTSRHTLRVETELEELVGQFDRARLERMVANLLSNAIKYSPDGGAVIVSVARATKGDPPTALLAVKDHGIGIPTADLPHVFERFHRAANTTGQIGGTGVGLTSVGMIVGQHGGSISVESDVGKGATFSVHLPLRRLQTS